MRVECFQLAACLALRSPPVRFVGIEPENQTRHRVTIESFDQNRSFTQRR